LGYFLRRKTLVWSEKIIFRRGIFVNDYFSSFPLSLFSFPFLYSLFIFRLGLKGLRERSLMEIDIVRIMAESATQLSIICYDNEQEKVLKEIEKRRKCGIV
jgi:hypothetical protein